MLDSADFGAPQRRRRLVLVAGFDCEPQIAQGEAERRTVRDAIGRFAGTAGSSGDPLHDHGEQRAEHVRSVIESIPKDGGSRADLGPDAQLQCHRQAEAQGAGWGREPYGRMAWDGIASTITGGCVNPSKGRFLHPDEDRAIHTPRSTAVAGIPRRSSPVVEARQVRSGGTRGQCDSTGVREGAGLPASECGQRPSGGGLVNGAPTDIEAILEDELTPEQRAAAVDHGTDVLESLNKGHLHS